MVSEQPYEAPERPSSLATWLALLVALLTAAGSLWLTMGFHLENVDVPHKMKLVPCPLCYYQRTFALSAFGVLFLGLLTGINKQHSLSLLALPLAIGGLAIAGFHVYLEMQGKLECPLGVSFGLGEFGTAPKQSLVGFGVLTLLLLIDVVVRRDDIAGREFSILLSLLVGAALTVGCLYSAPPLPPSPKTPYESPLEKCRPPYVEKQEPEEA